MNSKKRNSDTHAGGYFLLSLLAVSFLSLLSVYMLKGTEARGLATTPATSPAPSNLELGLSDRPVLIRDDGAVTLGDN